MRHHRFLNQVSTVLLLSLGLCILGGVGSNSAWAQDTGQNPNTAGAVQQVAPPGMSQEEWNQDLEQCNEVWAEVARREGLSADERAQLPSIYNAIENCRGMAGPVQNPGQTSVDPVLPVPVASPTPPSNLDSNPTAAAVSSSPSQSNKVSARHSLLVPRVPLRIDAPPLSEPDAAASRSSQSVLAVADASPALSSPGTLG